MILSAALELMLAGAAAAQDFQKTYRISPGSRIRVGNVSGDVVVTGL